MQGLIKKDFLLFIKDWKSVLLSFLLPIALISLFVFAFGGIGQGDSPPTRLLVADMDSTELSRELFSKIDSIKGIEAEDIGYEDALKAVKKGRRPAVLIIEKHFSDSVAAGASLPWELVYDRAREMEIGILQGALMSEVFGFLGKKGIKEKVFNNIEEKYGDLGPAILDDIKLSIEEDFSGGDDQLISQQGIPTRALNADEKTNWALIQALAGVAVMMVLFSVSAMGSTMLEEKENGTLVRLLYSPIAPVKILFAKFAYTVLVSFTQIIVMVIFAWLAFGLELFIDLPSLLILIFSTSFACSSFGIFLASICKSRKQVESLSVIIILVMSAIGGSMIPYFIMPAIMQKIAVISVNYWSIQGFYDIFGRELPFINVLYKSLVLLGIGTVMTILSVSWFKRNIIKIL